MKATTLKALTSAVFILALCSLAQAQATRTFVSGVGNDADPCSRTAPCKTFAGAFSKTFIGGEIDALDPGGYGTVTVSKSITIDGGGTFASILASGAASGVVVNVPVNANDPERRVTLRRLSINGTGPSGTVGLSTGVRGINAISFNVLNVENCYIQNLTTVGIDVEVTETGAELAVRDTNITRTGVGIRMNTTTGFVLGTIERVRINKMTTGFNIKDRAFVTLRDSYITNCSTAGVSFNTPSNSAGLNVENSVLYSVNTGIAAGNAGTTVDLSNTSILNNTNSITTGGATLNSHQNNRIANNTNPTPALNPVGQQ